MALGVLSTMDTILTVMEDHKEVFVSVMHRKVCGVFPHLALPAWSSL